jgi:hypothetical protein
MSYKETVSRKYKNIYNSCTDEKSPDGSTEKNPSSFRAFGKKSVFFYEVPQNRDRLGR